MPNKDTTPNNWLVLIEIDPKTGELIMPIPHDLLNQMGWDSGDDLIWHDNENGTFSLSKKEKDDDSIHS